MPESSPDSAVVVGIGNEIRADDGLGCIAAQLIEHDPRLPKNVRVIHGSTLGLELLPYLKKPRKIVFVDAVDVNAEPGRIIRLTEEGLRNLNGSSNAHQLGVADLLTALRLIRDDEPEVAILGMQPAVVDWGTELSPIVQSNMPELVNRVMTLLTTESPAVTPDAAPPSDLR